MKLLTAIIFSIILINKINSHEISNNYHPSHLMLILDRENSEQLPINFRTCKMPFHHTYVQSLPSRLGLDHLQISGSGQFSECDLLTIYKKLDSPKNFAIVDLRQESHGFANGMAISWYGNDNQANLGKTHREILRTEEQLLCSLLREPKTLIYKNDARNSSNFFSKINHVSTEKELVTKHGIIFVRLFITDHKAPTPRDIDAFLSFIHYLKAPTWIHFHCEKGEGRTTTFMTLYDIFRNGKTLSFEEIIERQYLLGGHNLLATDQEKSPADAKTRLDILLKFYDYCTTNDDSFKTSFTAFMQK